MHASPPTKHAPQKPINSLSIRLTESAVFLRSDGSVRNALHPDDRSSVLRGLLILNLVKPTKISAIDIELVAKSETSWPEGVGARKIEVTEDHRIFRASTTFFEASKAHFRRAASIGPGVSARDHDLHHDEWEDPLPNPLQHPANRRHEDGSPIEHPHTPNDERLSPARPTLPRGASVDASHYRPHHISDHEEQPQVPPYSPLPYSLSIPPTPFSDAPSAPSSPLSLSQEYTHAHNLDEFRTALNRDLLISPTQSTSTSTTQSYSPSHLDFPVSQPTEVALAEDSTSTSDQSYFRNPYRGSHIPHQPSSPPSSPDHSHDQNKHSRFTLANVSHVLMDVVRSTSPMFARSKERSKVDWANVARGRARDKKHNVEVTSPLTLQQGFEPEGRTKSPKEHHRLGVFGDILKLDDHKGAGRGWKEFKKGIYMYPISFQIPADSPPTMMCDYGVVTWRLRAHVHRPGPFRTKYTAERPVIIVSSPTEDDTEETENIIVERHWDDQLQYLIVVSGRSFPIGGTLPVTFSLLPLAKVKIYRIAIYLEERIDYYTNMRRIARSDPVSRLELLSIRNEGQDPMPILPLESDDAEAFRKSPFFAALSSQFENNNEMTELASSFMGPGPWTFHWDLELPKSCSILKPTNKNKRANMVVSHLLKIVMRLERGDDRYLDKNGRKMFDIVVQTPVHILSCRCNPEWTSLPRYSESLHQVEHVVRSCPCRTPQDLHLATRRGATKTTTTTTTRPNPIFERTKTCDSTDSKVFAAFNPTISASLTSRPRIHDMVIANTLFERLVSGQQSEMGEIPPAYELASPHYAPTLQVTAVTAS